MSFRVSNRESLIKHLEGDTACLERLRFCFRNSREKNRILGKRNEHSSFRSFSGRSSARSDKHLCDHRSCHEILASSVNDRGTEMTRQLATHIPVRDIDATEQDGLTVPLTRRDAANILRCSERKVDRLLRANLLESTRVGRSVLISPKSVAALIPQS
jgi:excisionase family DNA binding protein